jgi:hypothetical protein
LPLADMGPKHRAMVAIELPLAPFLRVAWGGYREDEQGAGVLEDAVAAHLDVGPGTEVWVLPLE